MQRRHRGLAGGLWTSSETTSSLSVITLDDGEQETDPGFPGLINTAVEFDLPVYTIKEGVGIPEMPRDVSIQRSYATGTGLSARVIRHKMLRDVGDAKAGQLVALKSFHTISNDTSTQSVICDAMIREIKALKHPLLHDHENICDLFCLAWAHRSCPASLILELGSYGTLEDVLREPGMGPSWLQKMNMTIDISLGLRAIHDAGMTHGDIKPANIIIQEHKNRQIVAKFIDFGGAASSDTSRPGMRTETWSAPEVIMNTHIIDWRSADVYSFGLVIASVWTRRPIHQATRPQPSCFLERYLPSSLNESQRSQRMLIMKTDPDTQDSWTGDPFSIGALSQSLIEDEHFINDLLCMALPATADRRKSMSIVVSIPILKLSNKIGRDINLGSPLRESATRILTPTAKVEPKHSAAGAVFGTSPNYGLTCDFESVSEPERISRVIVDGYIALTNPARVAMAANMHLFSHWQNHITTQPSDMPKTILSTLEKIELDPDMGGILRWAHFLGRWDLSTRLDISEQDRLSCMYASALGGSVESLVMAPLVGDSYDAHFPEDSIRLFCLVIGALLRHQQSATLLRESRPDLHESTRRILQARIPLSLELDKKSALSYLNEIQTAPLLEKDKADLLTLIASQNIEEITQFLGYRDCDAAITDMYGAGALHYLSYLSDEEATSLATICHEKGASLTQKTIHFGGILNPRFNSKPESTPLEIAMRRNMPRYSVCLLELHIQTGTPVSHDRSILLETIAFNYYYLLQVILERSPDNPEVFPEISEVPLEHCALYITRELMLMEDTSVERRNLYTRIGNGEEFQSSRMLTLHLVLDLSRELPEWPDYISQLAQASVKRHDHVALQAILECYKHSLPTCEEVFIRLTNPFLGSITCRRPKCFGQLLEVFPELARVGSTEDTCEPLLIAATNADSYFTKELLLHGACYNDEGNHFSYHPFLNTEQIRTLTRELGGLVYCPLFRALLHGHTESADLIYDSLTHGQQQLALSGLATDLVMGFWVEGHDLGVLDSITWMIERGKYGFLGHPGTPSWRVLIDRNPSALPEHIDLDVQVAKILFETFPDRLSYVDGRGTMIIHLMARHGHVEMLKLLLSMHVDINAETENDEDSLGRLTALDIAVIAASTCPDETIRKAGQAAISLWRRRLQETICLLKSHGAEFGKHSIFRVHDPFSTTVDLKGSNSTTPFDRTGQVGIDEWGSQDLTQGYPLRIKPDHTSPTTEEQEDVKIWVKARGVDGQVKKLNRGQYCDFLEKAAAFRMERWAIDRQHPLPLHLKLDVRSREWHGYGAMVTKEINNSIELIPRFHRLIIEMKSPSEILNPDVWSLLGYLNGTRRPWNAELQSSESLTKRINTISLASRDGIPGYASQEVEKQLSDLQAPTVPEEGFVLVTMLHEKTELTVEDVGIIQNHIGSCLVLIISWDTGMVDDRPIVTKRLVSI
ncbi:hypothetical protein F4814DRAFT_447532 [Daldinia grandis]|nr:hypothetical protein F4814DRAFT_447532 [Daldinia grandis]